MLFIRKSILIFLVLSSGQLACRKDRLLLSRETETKAIGTRLIRLAPTPRAKSSLELTSIGRSLVRLHGTPIPRISRWSEKGQRQVFKSALFDAVRDAEGIPRYQQEELLKSLVEKDSVACGGVSCARVFGVTDKDVPDLLDESLRDVEESSVLKKPEMAKTKEILLGSFQKVEGEDGIKKPLSGPQEVLYRMVQALGPKDIHFSANGVDVTLDIKPADLLRTDKIRCFKDLCESTMHIPFSVKTNIPAPLNSEVRITYSQNPNGQGKLIEQKAVIDGESKPVNIYEIVSVSINFSATLEKSAQTAEKIVVKDVRCKGTLNCNIPFLTFQAVVDNEGIELSGGAKSPSFDVGMIKVSQDSSQVTKRVKFEDLPKAVQKIKEGLAVIRSGIPREEMDFLWDEFAEFRGGQM